MFAIFAPKLKKYEKKTAIYDFCIVQFFGNTCPEIGQAI